MADIIKPVDIQIATAEEIKEVNSSVLEQLKETNKATSEMEALSLNLERLKLANRKYVSTSKTCRDKLETLLTELP